MVIKNPLRVVCIAGTASLLLAPSLLAQEAVKEAVSLQSGMQETSASVQRRIDALDDETRAMLNEYRQTAAQINDLQAYNEQLSRIVATQRGELADFERQFQEIEITKRKILPLILRMIEVLGDFIEIDMPFLEKERSMRLQELKTLMDRPEVPNSEKYRRVTEAYQIELEYGHTIEAYEGEIKDEAGSRTVAFLRYGRLGLYYMTLDGLEIGYWDKTADDWVQLSNEYRQPLDRALRIARKQLPPDLTRLPVPYPEDRT